MKKHTLFFNYYDNKETYIDYASKNNHKLYWKLLKDVFNNRIANYIPPLSHADSNGKDSTAFSYIDKIEILNNFFCSSLTFQTPVNPYQKCFYTVVNLLLIL